jgi:hypothetical protein
MEQWSVFRQLLKIGQIGKLLGINRAQSAILQFEFKTPKI